MYNFTKHKERKHFCMHCLQCFYSNESLAKHKVNCRIINGVQAIDLPGKYIDKNGIEKTPSVYFKNHHKGLPVPFCIYADFECITEKISSCNLQTENPTPKNIKNILLVVLVIKSFVIMIRSIPEM